MTRTFLSIASFLRLKFNIKILVRSLRSRKEVVECTCLKDVCELGQVLGYLDLKLNSN